MGKNTVKLAFFTDMHYKKGMYAATVEDLEAVIERAHDNEVDFIMHGGDFCNDYKDSPEMVNRLVNNKYGYKFYGVYGNHELEGPNSMEDITPYITNDKNVTWGTVDGKYDAYTAYYYFECKGIRFICLDTNYSFNPELNEYEHNRACSYGPPKGNSGVNSLSPRQLEWLEKILLDAAEKNIKCVVVSHAGFSCQFEANSCDYDKVRTLFDRINETKPGTVIASLNGHWHANCHEFANGVLYFNFNATRNICWLSTKTPHYTEDHHFMYTHFDKDGNAVESYKRPLSDLWMSLNTWYSKDALTAIVTVDTDGNIEVDGCESEFMHGIGLPDYVSPCRAPKITSGKWSVKNPNRFPF